MWPWSFEKEVLDWLETISKAQGNLAGSVTKLASIVTLTAQKVDSIFSSLGLKVSDLDINIEPSKKGSDIMANKKATGSPVKCPCLRDSKGKGAVMSPITLTTPPSSITLQPVDANNNPVALTSADNVVGTLASDSPSFVIGTGSDTLHYVATIPANTPLGTIVNLTATLNGTIQGAPANFTASVQVTLNIPLSPVAVDLDIIIA